MKTVTKEQCEAALGSISDAIEEYCLVVNRDVYGKLEAAQDVIHQLIEEHEKHIDAIQMQLNAILIITTRS